MNDAWAWWLVITGIGIGVAISWLVMGRLPRAEDDIAEEERAAEAAWISRSIAEYGGVAPAPQVEEILDLHRHYVAGLGIERSGHEADAAIDDAMGDASDIDGAAGVAGAERRPGPSQRPRSQGATPGTADGRS